MASEYKSLSLGAEEIARYQQPDLLTETLVTYISQHGPTSHHVDCKGRPMLVCVPMPEGVKAGDDLILHGKNRHLARVERVERKTTN